MKTSHDALCAYYLFCGTLPIHGKGYIYVIAVVALFDRILYREGVHCVDYSSQEQSFHMNKVTSLSLQHGFGELFLRHP